MALLFFDGFDHFGTNDLLYKWTGVSDTLPTISSSYGRNGNGAYIEWSNRGIYRNITAGSTTIIFGVAVRFTTTFTSSAGHIYCIMQAQKSAAGQCHVGVNSSGHVVFYRGDGTVIQEGTTNLSFNVWYYVEAKIVVATGTGGSYTVRINEAQEFTGSGVNTAQTGVAGWDRIWINGMAFGGQMAVDDIYVCDSTGTVNNDFLGDSLVEVRLPQTDAVAIGANVGLTPSTGTDHGALVDESTPNTTDYNSSAAVGSKDTYNYSDLTTTGGTVRGVQVHLFAAKANPGSRSICPVVRHGGVDYDGVSRNPSTSWTYYTQLYENNPGTSAPWTISEVNAAQFGMKVSA